MTSRAGMNLTRAARNERWATVHAWRLAGVPFHEIARRLAVGEKTIAEWYRQERHKRASEQAADLRSRDCKGCGAAFVSTGAGHRHCDDCRAAMSLVSTLAPDPGGHTGRRAGRPR